MVDPDTTFGDSAGGDYAGGGTPVCGGGLRARFLNEGEGGFSQAFTVHNSLN